MARRARHEAIAQTVWRLIRIHELADHHLGSFSTEGKAMTEGERFIAKEAGLACLRTPTWHSEPNGERVLAFRTHKAVWRVVVAPDVLDGAIQ